MADGQQIGRLLLIKMGNGATPTEVFTNLAGFKARSFNLSANEIETTIPDKTNPGGPVQRTSRPGITQRTFSGSGNFFTDVDSKLLMTKVRGAQIFNAEVIVPGDGSYKGPFMCSEFEFSGDEENNMEFSATFSAAGALTFTIEV